MSRFILVGASPNSIHRDHPGGQVTASIGLATYCDVNKHDLLVIDTTQSSFPVPSLASRLNRAFSRLRQLFSLLRSSKYDGVILFSSAGLSFYERLLMSYLCSLFSVQSMLFVRSGHFMNKLSSSKVEHAIVSRLLKYVPLVGAQGLAWKNFYEGLGVEQNRITVIPNWLHPNYAISNKPKCSLSGKVKFIFVGWLVKAKGLPQLLEAVKALSYDYQFEVTLVGGGDMLEGVEDLSRDELAGFLNVLGWRPQNEVRSILDEHDVFVLPSEAEGFPNAMLEAMAAGLPSICTNVGSVADSLIDRYNGFLLHNNSSDLIANAMLQYIKNPNLVETHSSNALKIVESNHSFSRNCELLLSQFCESNL